MRGSWRAGLAVVALSIGLSGCGLADDGAYDLPLPGGADVGEDPTTLTIHLDSVEGLVPLSNVKLDNVAVGTVEDIELQEDDWSAVVTAEVRGDLGLTDDVGARVRRSSLLGEWYVELVRPDQEVAAAAPLGDTGTIPVSRTGGSAGVEEVLGALSLLLNNGGLPQLDTILSELNDALTGNEAAVRGLLGELTEFTGQLDRRRDDIVQALDGLGRLSRTLRDNDRQIATALEGLPDGLRVLAEQRPQLTAMLRSLDRLSQVTVRVVEQSRDDVVADLELLRPVLASLRRSGSDLPDALEILPTFPFTPAAREAILGDYVNLEARVELDLGAVLEALLPLPAPTDQDGEDGPVPALPALPDLQDPLGVLDDLDDLVSGLADLPLLGGPTGSAPSGPDSGGLLGGLLGGGS